MGCLQKSATVDPLQHNRGVQRNSPGRAERDTMFSAMLRDVDFTYTKIYTNMEFKHIFRKLALIVPWERVRFHFESCLVRVDECV